MKFAIILMGVMLGINLSDTKGIMGSIIDNQRGNNNKYTSSWGHFMQKNMKKGHMAKSAIKGMLGVSLMS